MGGRDSVYAIAYAARVAMELGADAIKVHLPKLNPATGAASPSPYSTAEWTRESALRQFVESAGRTIVLISGGEGLTTKADVLGKARAVLDAGADGVLFGRSVWQRPFDEALTVSRRLSRLLRDTPPRARPAA